MNEQNEATKDTESTPMKKVLKIVHVDFKEQVCYVDNLVGVSNILESMLGDDDFWRSEYEPPWDDVVSISIVEIPVLEWEALEEFECFV